MDSGTVPFLHYRTGWPDKTEKRRGDKTRQDKTSPGNTYRQTDRPTDRQTDRQTGHDKAGQDRTEHSRTGQDRT